ncbi:MAG TPA: hypothetical protein VFN35_09365 [Ktedonobacteraceae bacterium]|nr:hypothetical protein [Ktedonobacteraceae bacterium]
MLLKETFTNKALSVVPSPKMRNSLGKRLGHWLLRKETFLVIILLCVAGLAHGINMLHFPYFEDDEGTYLSQAWAVVHKSHLAYYTYWYDHSPVGWFQIAFWAILTGGFHTFGSPLYSGRILMLVMQLGSTLLLYAIAKNISRNTLVALVIALLFALSPYGIYYHRRLLLDNIATLTLLMSILPLVSKNLTLNRVWLSALAFSIAVLSKEITVFVLPGLLCLVICQVEKAHRWIAASGWLVLVITLVSLYPLMAIINNELFPSGTWLGGNAPHVSLIGGVLYQASRGGDGGVFNFSSQFWIMTRYWMEDDPILVIGGTSAAVLSLVLIKRYRVVSILGLMSLCFWLYFMHGAKVIRFYLLPLLPLLALNLGLFLLVIGLEIGRLLSKLFASLEKIRPILQVAMFLVCVGGIVGGVTFSPLAVGYRSPDVGDPKNPLLVWNGTQADAQMTAVDWVTHHIPKQSRLVIDMYMWPDLYDRGYTNAHYYWKVETDPAIRDKVFHNDWRNFDYVILSPQMPVDQKAQNMTLLANAFAHSTPIISFDTGGWPIKILKVNKPHT